MKIHFSPVSSTENVVETATDALKHVLDRAEEILEGVEELGVGGVEAEEAEEERGDGGDAHGDVCGGQLREMAGTANGLDGLALLALALLAQATSCARLDLVTYGHESGRGKHGKQSHCIKTRNTAIAYKPGIQSVKKQPELQSLEINQKYGHCIAYKPETQSLKKQ